MSGSFLIESYIKRIGKTIFIGSLGGSVHKTTKGFIDNSRKACKLRISINGLRYSSH
jgi:hypothetical protein